MVLFTFCQKWDRENTHFKFIPVFHKSQPGRIVMDGRPITSDLEKVTHYVKSSQFQQTKPRPVPLIVEIHCDLLKGKNIQPWFFSMFPSYHFKLLIFITAYFPVIHQRLDSFMNNLQPLCQVKPNLYSPITINPFNLFKLLHNLFLGFLILYLFSEGGCLSS